MIEDILAYNKRFVAEKGYEKYITNKYPDKKIAILLYGYPFDRFTAGGLGHQERRCEDDKNAGGIISHPFGSVIVV